MDSIEFGKYIEELRTNKKMTKRQLELYSGVSNSYLSLLENGKRGVPSPKIIKRLSRALNVDYDEMMDKAGHIDRPSAKDEYHRIVFDISSFSEESMKKYGDLVFSIFEIIDTYASGHKPSKRHIDDVLRISGNVGIYVNKDLFERDPEDGCSNLLRVVENKVSAEEHRNNIGIEDLEVFYKVPEKGKEIIRSLSRAGELDEEDYDIIAKQVDDFIAYAQKKKNSPKA